MHLDEVTQGLYVGVIRHLWRDAQDLETELEITDLDPTGRLQWRARHEKPRDSIVFTLEALYETRFTPARGRSLFEFLRDLMLATVYACCPTRNMEVREATWRGVRIWEVEPGRTKPLRRWPIEAALTGELQVDDERYVLFITVGDIDATKSDEHRRIPLVGLARERFMAYAVAWVEDQLLSLTYLRQRSRRKLGPALRNASLRVDDLALTVGGKVLTSSLMRADEKAWRDSAGLKGQGFLRIAGGAPKKLDLTETDAIKTLIWADGAAYRYCQALNAFKQQTPISDVFVGTLFPSREGGVISDAHQRRIWRDHGWTAKDWLPKKLRQNAVQRYESERLRVLASLGRVAGHRNPRTTLEHYASNEPWLMAQVCQITEAALRRDHPGRGTLAEATERVTDALAALSDEERSAVEHGKVVPSPEDARVLRGEARREVSRAHAGQLNKTASGPGCVLSVTMSSEPVRPQRPGPDIPRRAPEYRGPVSPEILAAGMTAASQNAGRLLADAELLASAGRHPSAVALAVLAIEEAAKEDILAALATWPDEAKVFWRAFKWHVDKNGLGFVPLLHDRAYSPLETLIWLHENADDRYFDEMKWSGLYIDLLAGADGPIWWNPTELGEEHCKFFIAVARRVVRPRVVSPIEVEMMQRHVRPKEQKTLPERDAAMRDYLQEAVDRGLRPFEPWMARLGVIGTAAGPDSPARP